MRVLILIIPIIILGINRHTFAQTNCNKNLIDAENYYQSGRLYAIPDKLHECLNNGFNKEEKINAYRLLALTYLNINQEDNAKSAMLKLLKLNPDYKVVRGVDPKELYTLFTYFNTDPVYYTGIDLGVNLSLPYIINAHQSSAFEEAQAAQYTFQSGLNAALSFYYPLQKSLLLETKLAYQLNSYQLTDSYSSDLFSNELAVQQTVATEQMHTISVPINLTYILPLNRDRINVYLGTGIAPSATLTSGYTSIVRNHLKITTEEISGSLSSTMDYRRRFNLQTKAYLGAELKVGKLYYGIRAGYQVFIFAHQKYASVHDFFHNELSNNYGILEDDFVLQSAVIELNIKLPFYKFIN